MRQKPIVLFGTVIVWSIVTALVMILAWIGIGALLLMGSNTNLIVARDVQLILFIIGGFIAGAIVGGGQWFVLHGEVGWDKAWLNSTIVSWMCVALAWWMQFQILGRSQFKLEPHDTPTALIISGVVSGIVSGGVQWFMLRKSVSISPLWIASTGIVWLLAALIAALEHSQADFGLLSYFVPLVILGVIVGFGTGLAQSIFIGNTAKERN